MTSTGRPDSGTGCFWASSLPDLLSLSLSLGTGWGSGASLARPPAGSPPVACEFSQAPQSLPPLKSLSAQLGVLASRGPRRRTLDTCSTQVRVAEIGIRPKIKAVQLKHKSEQKKVGGLRAVIKWSLGRGPWKEGRRPLRTCCCKRNTTQPKIRHPGRSLSEGFYHSSRISNTTHLTKNISPPLPTPAPCGAGECTCSRSLHHWMDSQVANWVAGA